MRWHLRNINSCSARRARNVYDCCMRQIRWIINTLNRPATNRHSATWCDRQVSQIRVCR